ncbi:MAG: glycosyltransferase family 9 protein [bacterium]
MSNLIQKITELAYLSYARMQSQEEVIDMQDHLSQILTALIIAPSGPQAYPPAARLFRELQQIFPDAHFSLLVVKRFEADAHSHENLQVITYEAEQIGFHGLPKKELQDIIRARRFDLVVDLNCDFDLAAACLCQVSNAKLRVCLQNPQRDSLYNFQVRVADHHSVELKYDSLLKYLSIFRPLPNAPAQDLMPV